MGEPAARRCNAQDATPIRCVIARIARIRSEGIVPESGAQAVVLPFLRLKWLFSNVRCAVDQFSFHGARSRPDDTAMARLLATLRGNGLWVAYGRDLV